MLATPPPPPWAAPLAFAHARGWHSGAASRGRPRASIAWTASPGVVYRNRASADPPSATIARLPRTAIVVWALIDPASGGTRPLRLELGRARRLGCCDGLAQKDWVPTWELAGHVAGRPYAAIVRVYFGGTPTGPMLASARGALRRLRFPAAR